MYTLDSIPDKKFSTFVEIVKDGISAAFSLGKKMRQAKKFDILLKGFSAGHHANHSSLQADRSSRYLSQMVAVTCSDATSVLAESPVRLFRPV